MRGTCSSGYACGRPRRWCCQPLQASRAQDTAWHLSDGRRPALPKQGIGWPGHPEGWLRRRLHNPKVPRGNGDDGFPVFHVSLALIGASSVCVHLIVLTLLYHLIDLILFARPNFSNLHCACIKFLLGQCANFARSTIEGQPTDNRYDQVLI
jgi:hypothetical protein